MLGQVLMMAKSKYSAFYREYDLIINCLLMDKHLEKMETMARKNFELLSDNDFKQTSNWAKKFYNKHC